MVCSLDEDRLLRYCRLSLARRYIWIKENDFHWKGKKQTIFCRNYDGCKQRRWPSTSHKYTYPSRTPTALYRASKQQEALATTWMQIKQYMCFKQKGAIPALRGIPLKSPKVMSTYGLRRRCYWQFIVHREVWYIQWNKTRFHPSSSCVLTTLWMHHMDANQTQKK